MTKITKKKKIMQQKIEKKKEYDFYEAITILKTMQSKNFTESIDVSINLGIDPKKSDQSVRGSTILPHGIGRKIRIAAFTQGENIQKAKKYGADIAGGEELIKYFQDKKNIYDIVIATPDMMPVVGKLGPILGPKGIMPNPKTGTITNNIKEAIHNAKNGQINYKNDKNGIIHVTIGKINFPNEKILANLITLINALNKLKPIYSKGIFIKKITISTTMGMSFHLLANKLYKKNNK